MQSIFTLTQCKDNFGSHFNFCHHQVRSRGCKVFDGLAAEGGYHILQLAFGARIERRRREFNRVERDCESAVGRTKRHNVTFWGSRRVCACTCACVGAWVRGCVCVCVCVLAATLTSTCQCPDVKACSASKRHNRRISFRHARTRVELVHPSFGQPGATHQRAVR